MPRPSPKKSAGSRKTPGDARFEDAFGESGPRPSLGMMPLSPGGLSRWETAEEAARRSPISGSALAKIGAAGAGIGAAMSKKGREIGGKLKDRAGAELDAMNKWPDLMVEDASNAAIKKAQDFWKDKK